MGTRLSLLVSLAVISTFLVPGGMALGAPIAAPIHLGLAVTPSGSFGTTTTSTNWAGYAAIGATGSVSKVSGKWVQPSVRCGSSTSLAAFWVGIDGFNSNTVEQTGTIAECISGTAIYAVWWEMYPLNAVQVYAAVSAGDHFSATVTHNANGTFTMSITDTTTATTWATTASQSGTARTSAECIAEAPSGGSSLYPLSNFGHMRFSSCKATISGATHAIGVFSTVTAITMVSASSSTRIKASVSSLTNNTAFTVTWHHST
jgi:Peptidase A4 family